MDKNLIDVKENYIYRLDIELLDILLKDHSSGKNIIWATDNYASRGYGYQSYDYITVPVIYSYLKQAIDLLYDTKTSESGTIVYSEFTHTISDELEQLRCGIYHEEYHQTDPSPVYAEGACISDFMNKNTCVEFTTKPME